MVDGAAIFIAVLKLNGSVVAQDSQRILDNADEYQIAATPVVEGNRVCNAVEYDQATQTALYAKYNLSVNKNGSPISNDGIEYSYEIRNAMKVLKESGTAANNRVIIGPTHCLVSGSSIDSADAVFDDADVIVTATI
jgi:phosphoribosylpyrophosphate synthetase